MARQRVSYQLSIRYRSFPSGGAATVGPRRACRGTMPAQRIAQSTDLPVRIDGLGRVIDFMRGGRDNLWRFEKACACCCGADRSRVKSAAAPVRFAARSPCITEQSPCELGLSRQKRAAWAPCGRSSSSDPGRARERWRPSCDDETLETTPRAQELRRLLAVPTSPCQTMSGSRRIRFADPRQRLFATFPNRSAQHRRGVCSSGCRFPRAE